MVKTLEMAKKEAVQEAMNSCKNLTKAAQVLGVSRSTMYRLLTIYNIPRKK